MSVSGAKTVAPWKTREELLQDKVMGMEMVELFVLQIQVVFLILLVQVVVIGWVVVASKVLAKQWGR